LRAARDLRGKETGRYSGCNALPAPKHGGIPATQEKSAKKTLCSMCMASPLRHHDTDGDVPEFGKLMFNHDRICAKFQNLSTTFCSFLFNNHKECKLLFPGIQDGRRSMMI